MHGMEYSIQETEKKWQVFWEKKKVYAYDVHSKKDVFTIDTPPPTVSGAMHLGHAFSYAQGDFIARYKRMQGYEVFYPYGTDDNGLPTERLIESIHKIKAPRMDRNEFVKLCAKTLNEIKPPFIQGWKGIGISCEFDKSYSTIDSHCIATSQKSFIDLYKKGRVYNEETPMMWCTVCQTAIAQAELDDVEMQSSFNDIVFKVGEKELVIATTRPELLCACVAVIAHPADTRYKKYIGKYATVPLFKYDVPIIGDEKADPEKGTGIVMCCTFGDQTDIAWWRTHHLPLKVAVNNAGKMTEIAGAYAGLSLKECRKKIVEDLKQQGLLLIQKPITHSVRVHERCGTEIEFLKTKQWFIRILDKKQELLALADAMHWHPPHMKARYVNWVENLQWDWCISRQRFFGVPFPVWFCEKCGAIHCADAETLPVDPLKDTPQRSCSSCKNRSWIPEKDVMDTWATSSLTPQIALNWLHDKNFEQRFPMDVRLQAHDIIRTWAFYTIVKAQYSHAKVPWKHLMISGHALDPHGKKMSKSKGNVVDPQIVVQEYGADALRFWAASSSLGEDVPYQEKEVITGKKTVVKLYNAAKFTFGNLKEYRLQQPDLQVIDRWMLDKTQQVIKLCTEQFEQYEYAKARLATEHFFWHTFCDYYLELVKDRLYQPEKYEQGKDKKQSAQFVLYQVFLGTLKLCAPIMPHIAEELYQQYYAKKEGCKSIHLSQWPQVNNDFVDSPAGLAGDLLCDILARIRKFKSENSRSLKSPVKKLIIEASPEHRHSIELVLSDLKAAAIVDTIEFGKGMLPCEKYPLKLSIEVP